MAPNMLQVPMEALHKRAVAAAVPITTDNASQLLLPVVALGFQIYALTYHGTKWIRLALWPVVVVLMFRSWFGFRFIQPHFQDFNYALGISAIHLLIKTTEYALANVPSPPVQIPGRPAPSRLRQTINIAINSRHVGLPPNAPLDAFQPRQTRLRASLNHAKSALVHYLVFDSIFHAVHAYAHDTLGNPHGGSLEAFAQDIAQNYPWPHVPLVVQRTVWELSAVGVAGIGIYQGMTYLYHTFAALAICLFGWQPEEWPPFYDKPWMATSLYELWGKRWHQLFRHQFILLAEGLQKYLRLPIIVLPTLVFSLSGLLHVLGALTATPFPDTVPIFLFFALSGVGCTLELAYRRFRGKRVQGLGGWLWTWTWIAVTGRSVARSWIASGVLGSTLVWEKASVVGYVMSLRDENGNFPKWFYRASYFAVMCTMLAILDQRAKSAEAVKNENSTPPAGKSLQAVEPPAVAPSAHSIEAVPADLSAQVGPSHSARRKALLCFPLLILLALPFWDYTTKIERLPLPVDRIHALESLKLPEIVSKVYLTLDDRVFPPNVDRGSLTRALVRDIRLASDGIIHREQGIVENRTWDVVTTWPAGGPSPSLRIHVWTTSQAEPGFPLCPYILSEATKLPTKAGKKQTFKAGTYVVPVNPSHISDPMFRNHLANAIIRPMIALLPTAPPPAPLRALKYSKDITLSFVLLNEDSSNGGFISSWDIQEALDKHVLPHLTPLSPVHNFTIETQVLLHAPLSFSPTRGRSPSTAATAEAIVAEAVDSGGDPQLERMAEAAVDREVDDGRDGAWLVDDEQIKEFVNSEQWSLDSGSSNNPVLRFLLFAPGASHRPLRLAVTDGAQSFLLPQYGGVAFYNLPRAAPAQAHHLPLQALSPSFHLFTQHLYSLLALPPLPTPNPFDPSRSYTSFSPFQLETLMRVRAAENVEEAQKTLAGITRLVDKIKEMKVGEGVRGKVLGAVERLETVLNASPVDLSVSQAFELSRNAVTLANEAFFDPSMMGLLYFPTEHKAAVYTPLFAPVAVPIVLFLLKEFVAWKRARRISQSVQ